MSQTFSSSGAVPGGTPPQGVQDLERIKNTYEHAIQEMEKHISVAHDGTIVLSAKSGPDIQVDPDAFNNLSNSLQHLNGLLRNHQVFPSQIRLKTPIGGSSTVSAALKATANDASIITAGACASTTWFEFYWWGFRLHLNECATQELIALLYTLAIGALVYALISLFWPPSWIDALMYGIAAALLFIGANLLKAQDQACGNQGLVLHVSYFPGIWVGCS